MIVTSGACLPLHEPRCGRQGVGKYVLRSSYPIKFRRPLLYLLKSCCLSYERRSNDILSSPKAVSTLLLTNRF